MELLAFEFLESGILLLRYLFKAITKYWFSVTATGIRILPSPVFALFA